MARADVRERGYRGAVVLGAPRSGTTLLRRLLDAHPSICAPPETYLLIACANFIQDEPTVSGPPLGVTTGLWFSGIEEQVLLERVRNLAFDLLDQIRDRAGKQIWVEKTGSSSFHIDDIERVLAGHCRYICIVRHGLDVALATREMCDKLGTYPSRYHRYIQREQRPLAAFARAWVDICSRVDRLCADHPEQTLRIRYEDLVGDPSATLARICGFLEVSSDCERLVAAAFERGESVGMGDWKSQRTCGVSTASVDRWRTQLAPEAVHAMAEILNPMLEAQGYEPLPTAPVVSREQHLRRYERASLLSRFRVGIADQG
jgi:hypothetical protein